MNKMIEVIKEIHSQSVCMFKIGNFYHTYNRDSHIMAYLFKYRIKELGCNHKECGFPVISLPKVLAKLENDNNYGVRPVASKKLWLCRPRLHKRSFR